MTTLATAPRIRLRPAPACDPPFEDEAGSRAWPAPAQPTLAPSGGRPTSAPHRRPPPSPDVAPAGTSGQARDAAHRFMHTCLEILNGYRPVAHFRALSDPLAAATVLDAMTRGSRRLTSAGGAQRVVSLRRMRVCEPRSGVAEISAVLATRSPGRTRGGVTAGDRCFAAAFRLERRHGRWQCHIARLL